MGRRKSGTEPHGAGVPLDRISALEGELEEMRYREMFLFQANPVPMWIFDLETLCFLDVNDAAVELYGYTREEFLSMSILDIHPQTDYGALVDFVRETTVYLPRVLGVWRHLRKDGGNLRVEVTGSDIEFKGWAARLVQLHDVTERERTLAQLRSVESEIRTLVEHAPYLISRFDLDLRYLYTSPAAIGITGRKPAEIIGKTHWELGYPPEFCAYIQREYKAVLDDGVSRDVEFTFDTPSGKRHFLARAVAERSAGGEIVSIVTVTKDMTERKLADIALRESEARFRALTALMSDWYWEQDAEMRFTHVSERWYEITGVRSEDILGRTRQEYAAGSGMQTDWHGLEKTISARRPFRDIRVSSRRSDGSAMTVETSGVPVFDASGGFIGYQGVGRDVTAREQAAESLRQSQGRFQAITELARDWYWEQDGQFRFTFISPRAFEIVRAEFSQVIGKARWEMPHLAHDEKFWEEHRRLLERHEPFHNLLLQRIDDDGRLHLLSVSGAPFFDSEGRFLGYRGLTRDITAAEQARAAARDLGSLLRKVVEALGHVLVIRAAESGQVLYVSPAFEKLWEMQAEEVYRDARAWLTRLHPDDLDRVNEYLRDQPRVPQAEVEYRLLRRDGRVHWVWAQSFLFSDESGSSLVASVVIDITHRRREEEKRLENAKRQRNALVREVHHRIKNNLQGVIGILRMHASRQSPVETAIDAAVSQVQAVAAVHGIQGKLGAAVLCRVVHAVAGMLESVMGGRISVQVAENVGSGIVLAESDAVAVALVLNELMMNAMKHGRDHGPVEVYVSRTNGGARVRVLNRGVLDEAFQFERGLGIGTGLELVKALTPDEGMTVMLWSENNQTTAELKLDLPVIVHGGHVSVDREQGD